MSGDRLGWWPKDDAEATAVAERTKKFLARPEIREQIDASLADTVADRAKRRAAGQPTSVDVNDVLARLGKKGRGQ